VDSLEEAVDEVLSLMEQRAEKLKGVPSKLYLTPYPHETDAMFEKRCIDSKKLLEKFGG